MALLGKAAMALSFVIEDEALAEHDAWHSTEHLAERLSIPGFLRGTRWRSTTQAGRYFVLYEVVDLDVLSSPAYLERLNHPTPWTAAMMTRYRGMQRGFCRVVTSSGCGLGQFGLPVRIKPGPGLDERFRHWAEAELPARIADQRGLVSAHVLATGATPAMTEEQRIRGADGGVDWLVFVTGYDLAAVQQFAKDRLTEERLGEFGVPEPDRAIYQLQHVADRGRVA